MKVSGIVQQPSRYVTFKLHDNLAGINILDIREIVPFARITPVPQAPEFIMGLINLRGQILAILDIGILLGMGKREYGAESHFIIFKHKDTGFAVDRIGDVIITDETRTGKIPENLNPQLHSYIENVIDMPEDILMVLNARKMLSASLSDLEAFKGAV